MLAKRNTHFRKRCLQVTQTLQGLPCTCTPTARTYQTRQDSQSIIFKFTQFGNIVSDIADLAGTLRRLRTQLPQLLSLPSAAKPANRRGHPSRSPARRRPAKGTAPGAAAIGGLEGPGRREPRA
eukprot:7587870-Alexandrium_andersonii.AAC.1